MNKSKQTSLLVHGYEVVIGFETHAQLSTHSKIFSRASVAFGADPNTQACAVDMALPGTLPVMNKGAVERAIQFGLAVGSHVAERSIFARKNYFYPDLPKGYQISQFEIPVVQGGEVSFFLGNEKKTVRLVRAHLEEDAGKSLHEDFHGQSGIDLNRAGTPLLEIVTEPDIRSSAEAVAYAKELHKIVTWIGICDGNMQEGSFRCDANVSVRKPGAPLGTRREIKNLNSFKFMQQAIDFEVRWQIEQIEDGYEIEQATVLFDPDTGETRAMRTKEDAADYRYFPDPDLPPLVIGRDWVEQVRADMPELPRDLERLYVEEYSLTPYMASQVVSTYAKALFFNSAVIQNSDTDAISAALLDDPGFYKPFARRVAVWISGEISRVMNEEGGPDWQFWISPVTLARIALREQEGVISGKAAKELFDYIWKKGRDEKANAPPDLVDSLIESKNLKQIDNADELRSIITEVISKNSDSVSQYKSGKEKAFNSLVGQIMKMTKGKANPTQVNSVLKEMLSL